MEVVCSSETTVSLCTRHYIPEHRTGHIQYTYVRWVPCHHGMDRPQVADGANGIQILGVAANILNKQSGTANKGGGVRLTTLHRKK
jgi:hypothetical protein